MHHNPTAAQQRLFNAALHLFAQKGTTEITVRELADTAGVARGTVYNNVTDIDTLFAQVATSVALEMNQRILSSFRNINDPSVKLASAIRFYIKRAHEDPDWGLFVCRFGFTSVELRRLGAGLPMQLLLDGMKRGQYDLRSDQLPTLITTLSSAVLGAIYLVREGIRTWRDAGSDCAEIILRALGISAEQAREIATDKLGDFPEPRAHVFTAAM